VQPELGAGLARAACGQRGGWELSIDGVGAEGRGTASCTSADGQAPDRAWASAGRQRPVWGASKGQCGTGRKGKGHRGRTQDRAEHHVRLGTASHLAQHIHVVGHLGVGWGLSASGSHAFIVCVGGSGQAEEGTAGSRAQQLACTRLLAAPATSRPLHAALEWGCSAAAYPHSSGGSAVGVHPRGHNSLAHGQHARCIAHPPAREWGKAHAGAARCVGKAAQARKHRAACMLRACGPHKEGTLTRHTALQRLRTGCTRSSRRPPPHPPTHPQAPTATTTHPHARLHTHIHTHHHTTTQALTAAAPRSRCRG
jgi:hypothetical protein